MTLYEMLCGVLPFSGPPEIVIFNVVQTEPPRPRSVATAIPRDLETICLKAMAKESAGRYVDCHEMAADLRRWLEDEPIRARQVTWAERGWRWCRRNPAVAGLTAAVCATIVLALAVTTWQGGVARTERNIAQAAVSRERDALSQSRDAAEKERRARSVASQESQRSERLNYANQIAAAYSAWRENDAMAARTLLVSTNSEHQADRQRQPR